MARHAPTSREIVHLFMYLASGGVLLSFHVMLMSFKNGTEYFFPFFFFLFNLKFPWGRLEKKTQILRVVVRELQASFVPGVKGAPESQGRAAGRGRRSRPQPRRVSLLSPPAHSSLIPCQRPGPDRCGATPMPLISVTPMPPGAVTPAPSQGCMHHGAEQPPISPAGEPGG